MGANPNALDPDLRAAMNDLQQWLGSQRVILTSRQQSVPAVTRIFCGGAIKAGRSGGLPPRRLGTLPTSTVGRSMLWLVPVSTRWQWAGPWEQTGVESGAGARTLSTLNSQELATSMAARENQERSRKRRSETLSAHGQPMLWYRRLICSRGPASQAFFSCFPRSPKMKHLQVLSSPYENSSSG